MFFSILPQKKSAKEIAAESDAEMRRYDLLGPKARAAIDNSPRCVNIKEAIRAFKLSRDPFTEGVDGWLPEFDFKDPASDERFAKYIDDKIVKPTGKSIAECTIQPWRNKK